MASEAKADSRNLSLDNEHCSVRQLHLLRELGEAAHVVAQAVEHDEQVEVGPRGGDELGLQALEGWFRAARRRRHRLQV